MGIATSSTECKVSQPFWSQWRWTLCTGVKTSAVGNLRRTFQGWRQTMGAQVICHAVVEAIWPSPDGMESLVNMGFLRRSISIPSTFNLALQQNEKKVGYSCTYCWWFRNPAFTQLRLGLYFIPLFSGFFCIPGGDRRISEPSTVVLCMMRMYKTHQKWWDQLPTSTGFKRRCFWTINRMDPFWSWTTPLLPGPLWGLGPPPLGRFWRGTQSLSRLGTTLASRQASKQVQNWEKTAAKTEVWKKFMQNLSFQTFRSTLNCTADWRY